MPHRELELRVLFRQLLADRQLARGVVDGHRQAERQRREAFGLALGDAAQRRRLDQHGHVFQLERADLERVHAAELQAAQADFADAGAQRVGDRAHARRRGRLPRDGRLFGAGVEHEVLPAAAVDARLHDHLVVDELEVDGVQTLGDRLVDRIGSFSPNDFRKRTCDRDHAALSLRSLLGSRLM